MTSTEQLIERFIATLASLGGSAGNQRLLEALGYLPDLQDTAVQTVLQQAEALSAMWNLPSSGGDAP